MVHGSCSSLPAVCCLVVVFSFVVLDWLCVSDVGLTGVFGSEWVCWVWLFPFALAFRFSRVSGFGVWWGWRQDGGPPGGAGGDALVCMSCWLRHARCSGYGWFGVWDGGGGP